MSKGSLFLKRRGWGYLPITGILRGTRTEFSDRTKLESPICWTSKDILFLKTPDTVIWYRNGGFRVKIKTGMVLLCWWKASIIRLKPSYHRGCIYTPGKWLSVLERKIKSSWIWQGRQGIHKMGNWYITISESTVVWKSGYWVILGSKYDEYIRTLVMIGMSSMKPMPMKKNTGTSLILGT